MRPADVNVEYRKNLDSYNAWEQQEDEKQKEAIAALKRRERKSAPGMRVPQWLRIVIAIVAAAVVVYMFVVLVFSQKG